MATTISVVQYTNSSPHKMNILQQSTNTNNNNNDQRREIIILRKPPPLLAQTKELSKEDILITNTAKKKLNNKSKDITQLTKPAPIAVARRNARERNRVKQVNNGFANLRQHIPNSIAAAYESSNGRGGNKKLSKVETLRMAVDYIRRLEEILASSGENNENFDSSSINSFQSFSASPSLTTQSNATYSYPILSPSADEDDLSTNPTPPPQQYVKIQGTHSYQIIPVHLYEDNENLEPLDDHILSDPSLLSSDLEFSYVQDLSLLNSIHTNGSLSPEMYSDSSLSPQSLEKSTEQHQIYNIPVFNNKLISGNLDLQDIKPRLTPTYQNIQITENQILLQAEEVKFRLSPNAVQIKTEEPIPFNIKSEEQEMVQAQVFASNVQKPTYADVMKWWEEQQNNHNS